jgi:hypothetical protein
MTEAPGVLLAGWLDDTTPTSAHIAAQAPAATPPPPTTILMANPTRQ